MPLKLPHYIAPTLCCYPNRTVRLSQDWHVRTWCDDRREYRDFNLGHMAAGPQYIGLVQQEYFPGAPHVC
jgi:hypothetical protein